MDSATTAAAEPASAPEAPAVLTVQHLLEAGVHFGHRTNRWNPKMKKYIFGARNGIYIIDLEKTLLHIEEARQFLCEVVASGRRVLFVGTKKQAQETVRATAESLSQPYVVYRWLGGMLTNNQTIRKSVAKMRKFQQMAADGTLDKLPKKEIAGIRRELAKLDRDLRGVADMEGMPGAVVVFDICRDAIAVSEAVKMKIPIVALCDTNTDPTPISYPIPANDDAIRSIRLVAQYLARGLREAVDNYARQAAEQARVRAIAEAEEKARQKAAEEERRARERDQRKARQEALAKAKAAKAAETAAKNAAEAAAPGAPAEPAPGA